MQWVRKFLSSFISQMISQWALGQLRQRAVLAYLKILNTARRSLIAALALFFVLQLMVFGFIGAVVTTVWLWPADVETKLVLLLGIFAALFAIPLLFLMFFLSERLWFKASGAAQIMKMDR